MEGWIKIHRTEMEKAVFTSNNANLWKVWSWCLMKATHTKHKIFFDGEEIELLPGQFISGRFAGAEECHMKPSTFRNQIERLRKLKYLDSKSDNKKTIFTVVNWALLQSQEETRTAKRTASGQQVDTYKNERIKEEINDFFQMVRPLMKNVQDDQAVYAILNKHSRELGQEKLRQVLESCIRNKNQFDNEGRLNSYLQTCLQNRGTKGDSLRSGKKVTDELKVIDPSKPGWI
jgi:hypothetical protein